MTQNTKIEWATHTFNPWIGCTKVGPGCDNCYAKADFEDRKHRVVWGAGQPRSRTSAANWQLPLRWNAQHDEFFAMHGHRQRVFCASLADVFDNSIDPQWRADLFQLIEATPNLDWLLLTKRIGNVPALVPEATDLIDYGEGWQSMWGQGVWPKNVWLGATIVNREELLRDGPKLAAIPADVKFWSAEPMLGDLGAVPPELLPDWVIVGGESGPSARPMHPDWARSLRDQCEAVGVPFMFKQWGGWISADQDNCPSGPPFKDWMWADGAVFAPGDGQRAMPLFRKVSKQSAGRLLDGFECNGAPQ